MKHSTTWVRSGLITVAVALFWLGVWQGLSMLVAQELLLPAPLVVARTLVKLGITPAFWKLTAFSLLRVLLGFVSAVVVGCVLAVLTKRFWLLDKLLAPLLHLIRAAPVASFIILALVWLRTDILPAFIAFLMVVPVVWDNVSKGLREIDVGLLEVAQIYRFGILKTLLKVKIPSVMPYFMAACTTGLGFAWKSGIAAEVICLPAFSIGTGLQHAKIYLETPEVFAWTAVVVALSVLLEALLKHVAAHLERYKYGRE